MSDIVERLRIEDDGEMSLKTLRSLHEAADEIERLRSLLKEAGIAIERVTNFAEGQDWDIPPVSLEWEAAIQTLGSVLSKIKGEA